MDTTVAIVIPYFQRSQGILRRALESIERQCNKRIAQIIVVDDSSPVPAREEVADFNGDIRSLICVVLRPNGGPGAARNAGLDQVASGVDYVAFLDSDDSWADDHLTSALDALDRGFDLYFADSVEAEASASHFSSDCRGAFERFEPFDVASQLYVYPANLFDQILEKSLIATSTVVYRYSAFSRLRFRTDFRIGEDRFFWLCLLSCGGRAICSNRIGLHFGKGVNIYRGIRWGDHEAFSALTQQIRMQRAVEDSFELTSDQVARNRTILSSHVKSFFLNGLHRLARGDWRALQASLTLLIEYPEALKLCLKMRAANQPQSARSRTR